MSVLTRIKADTFRPLKEKVFVSDLDNGVQLTKKGIILPDDNMTNRGIRSRWAKVWAIGEGVEDLQVGDWVLLKHGRWTERILLELADETVEVWRIDYPDAVLLVSEEDPRTDLHTTL